jgi:HK97 family phage prohead protease
MKRRNSQSPVEVNPERRRLTWYAAVFNAPTDIQEINELGTLTRYREIIAPTAFDASIKSGQEVLANIEHDDARTFAKRSLGELMLTADPYGLFATAWLVKNDRGDEIIHKVRNGELNASSFAFNPQEQRMGEDGEVVRTKVDLHDVSLVTNPAYPQTKGEVMLRSAQDDSRIKFLLSRYKFCLLKNRRR